MSVSVSVNVNVNAAMACLHALEEGDGFPAIDEPVVIRERDVHHRADLDLPLDGDGAREDAVHPEDGRLCGRGGGQA